MNCSTSRTAEQNEAIDWLNIRVTFLELKSHQGDTEPALKAAFYPPRCFEFTILLLSVGLLPQNCNQSCP